MKKPTCFQSGALLGGVILLISACGPSTSYDSGYGDSGSNNNGGTQTGLGYTWEVGQSGTTSGFRSIAYGNGNFVAVGTGAGVGVTAASGDGKSWSLTQQNDTYHYDLSWVAYGNGRFVALASLGALVSSDGVNWAAANVPQLNLNGTPLPQSLTAAAYGNGLWVAVDNTFYTENGLGIWTSADGSNWSGTLLNTPYAQPTAIAFGNGLFVIVGYGGLLLTSPDGANWTNHSLSSGLAMMSVIYANDKFVAVTNGGSVVLSTDGSTWTTYSTSSVGFSAITYGNGLFVAAGGVHAYLSQDAQNWTEVTSYLPNATASSSLTAAAYGGSSFVLVGDNGVVDVSP